MSQLPKYDVTTINLRGVKLFVVENSGQWWLGVKAGLVRGRIEVELVGDLTPRLAPMIRREIQCVAGRTGREPMLVDLRGVESGCGGSVATAIAISYAVLAANGAPCALVGRVAAAAAAAQQAMDARVAWFPGPAQARRWLREQMVA